jgi:uncharacterized iron-regulated membrane protein
MAKPATCDNASCSHSQEHTLASPLLRARPALMTVHRWIGIGLGLLILLQGLTGTVTAFRHELDRLWQPGAFLVAPGRPAAPVQAVVAAVRAAAPEARLGRLDYPTRPDEAYVAHLESRAGGQMLATVDPATARVLRQGPLSTWPAEFIYMLHHNLVSGEVGERIVGLGGLALLFLVLTGPLVWWPGVGGVRRNLAVETRRGAWRTLRDLHRLVGVLIFLLLGLIAFTGLNMAWRPWLRPVVALFGPVHGGPQGRPHDHPPHARCKAPLSRDQAVAAAQALRPRETVRGLRLQGPHTVGVMLAAQIGRPGAVDQVTVDACSGRATLRDARAQGTDAFYTWLRPLHTGEWLGLPGRILGEVAALSLTGLGASGYALWGLRTLRQRRARARDVRAGLVAAPARS